MAIRGAGGPARATIRADGPRVFLKESAIRADGRASILSLTSPMKPIRTLQQAAALVPLAMGRRQGTSRKALAERLGPLRGA